MIFFRDESGPQNRLRCSGVWSVGLRVRKGIFERMVCGRCHRSLSEKDGIAAMNEAAARRNSENVLVVWNNPQVAASYLKHWQSRYEQGIDYTSSY